jgi:hypothetical protein
MDLALVIGQRAGKSGEEFYRCSPSGRGGRAFRADLEIPNAERFPNPIESVTSEHANCVSEPWRGVTRVFARASVKVVLRIWFGARFFCANGRSLERVAHASRALSAHVKEHGRQAPPFRAEPCRPAALRRARSGACETDAQANVRRQAHNWPSARYKAFGWLGLTPAILCSMFCIDRNHRTKGRNRL